MVKCKQLYSMQGNVGFPYSQNTLQYLIPLTLSVRDS